MCGSLFVIPTIKTAPNGGSRYERKGAAIKCDARRRASEKVTDRSDDRSKDMLTDLVRTI
jgi:hypothetical protein